MPSLTSDARFLGVDLKTLWRDVRSPWARMHQWPFVSWLVPSMPVLLLQANGGRSVWMEGKPSQATSKKTRFVAVELPEELILRRRLTIPAMAQSHTTDAVALEARAMAPFSPQDLVWGYHAHPSQQGVSHIDMVLVSRKQVAQYLLEQASRLPQGAEPEVWALAGKGVPIALRGYGEGLRQRHAQTWRRAGYAMVLMALALLIAMALTPTAQLRLRAIEAVQAYESLTQRTTPLVRKREMLLQSAEQLGGLSDILAGRIEPLRILDRLTKVLPDDTSLQNFKLQGLKVTISGLTANASALMQLLSGQPGLHDVRAPSAATRMAGTNNESFTVEFMLDPREFGVVTASSASTSVAAGSSQEGQATPARPSNSGETTAPLPTASAVSPIKNSNGAAFGGSGSRPKASAAPAIAPTAKPTTP